MSIMVGVGRGAQIGVLVKNAEALERLEKITTLVADKTGTLTEGKPKLMDVLPADGFDSKDFLRLAASLEQNSEHPLAAEIVRGAKEQSLALDEVKDFRSVTAGGVAGTIAGRIVMVGKPDFLRDEKVIGLEPLETSAAKLQEDGKTAMFVAIDGKPAGILAVADPIYGRRRQTRFKREKEHGDHGSVCDMGCCVFRCMDNRYVRKCHPHKNRLSKKNCG